LIYKPRFTSERRFAGLDKFRAPLIRFDRKDDHHLAYARFNLRHVFATAG